VKKAFLIGSIFGGLLGVGVALGMDLIVGGALGSGWQEAVAHDLGALFGRTFSTDSVVVIVGAVLVIGLIGAFGAFIGGLFGVFMARLLLFLSKGDGSAT
jgi:hypothetical protein